MPCKSPDWCPCCCHTSEAEPTSGRWIPGKWRRCRSGPPFLWWCHPRNKSGRSCPRQCLLTGGERRGEVRRWGRGVRRIGGISACMTQWTEHDEYMCQAWLPIIQVTAKSTAVNYSWAAFLLLNNFWSRSGKGCIHKVYVHSPHLVPPPPLPPISVGGVVSEWQVQAISDIRNNQQSVLRFRNECATERIWQHRPISDERGWKAVAMVTTVN